MQVSYSASFAAILAETKSTLAVSTYQSGKLMLISSLNGKHVVQFAKNLPRPMGIAINDKGLMAVACKSTVEVFGNHRSLALTFPKEPRKYDGMFFPRATYYTGQADMHDIAWHEGGLIGVNTAFSCLSRITHHASFEPFWQPEFITDLVPDDRCHLNGLAMDDGQPKYVSLLGRSNVKQGWRENKLESGLIIDIQTGEVVADQLAMPHSPRVFNGQLFFLLSGVGEIYRYDPSTKKIYLYAEGEGFVRGMTQLGGYLIVALSTVRESSRSFGDLPVVGRNHRAGLLVYELESGAKVADFFWEEQIKEIFDVHVLSGVRRGVMLDKKGEIPKRAVAIDADRYFWKKEEAPKSDEKPANQG